MMRIAAPMAVVMALMFVNFHAAAEEGKPDRGSKEQQEACTPDVYRLCNDAVPDEKRIVACLKHNRSKLSPACRRVFSEN